MSGRYFCLLYRMANSLTDITTYIIVGLIGFLIFTLVLSTTKGNVVWANFTIMISFLLVVIMIAIPFITINVDIAPSNDTINSTIRETIIWTSVIFIGFLIITFMILRVYPSLISSFVNLFTTLSFATSLIVLTLYSIDKFK